MIPSLRVPRVGLGPPGILVRVSRGRTLATAGFSIHRGLVR